MRRDWPFPQFMPIRHTSSVHVVGEAKRRGSRPPSAPERLRRPLISYWHLFPAWLRSISKVSFTAVFVYLAIGLVCLGVVWLAARVLSIR
jgi:hypothetical protein